MSTAQASRSQPTDESLVASAQAGDVRAFTRIYQRHADRVFGLITKILGPVDGREDLLQDIFVQLHHALPSFRGDAQLWTFLYRIAVRSVMKHARRRRGVVLPLDSSRIDSCISADRSPSQQASDRQTLANAFSVIDTLKTERRVAFVLVAVESLSYDEAATVLDISPAAVKQRTLRARKDISRALDRAARTTRAGRPT